MRDDDRRRYLTHQTGRRQWIPRGGSVLSVTYKKKRKAEQMLVQDGELTPRAGATAPEMVLQQNPLCPTALSRKRLHSRRLRHWMLSRRGYRWRP